jgi:hypothetical protein
LLVSIAVEKGAHERAGDVLARLSAAAIFQVRGASAAKVYQAPHAHEARAIP